MKEKFICRNCKYNYKNFCRNIDGEVEYGCEILDFDKERNCFVPSEMIIQDILEYLDENDRYIYEMDKSLDEEDLMKKIKGGTWPKRMRSSNIIVKPNGEIIKY